jgi:hypothetical protein
VNAIACAMFEALQIAQKPVSNVALLEHLEQFSDQAFEKNITKILTTE